MHLFELALGYRFLKTGEKIEVNDVVFNDFGGAEFKIGEKHNDVGTEYDEVTMSPIARKKENN